MIKNTLTESDAKANARVITELLKACEAVLEWWDSFDTESIGATERRFDKLRAAVNKAQGKDV